MTTKQLQAYAAIAAIVLFGLGYLLGSSGKKFGTGTTTYTFPTITASGAATFDSTVGVAGATTLGSTLGVPSALTTLSTLSVTSTAIVAGASTLTGTVQATAINASTQVSSTQLVVGQGTPILTVLFATGTRNFASIAGTYNLVGSVTSTLLTVTGAALRDPCFLSLPDWGNESAGAAATSTLNWNCKVVASDTVSIEANNVSTSTAEDVPSRSFGASVLHFNK